MRFVGARAYAFVGVTAGDLYFTHFFNLVIWKIGYQETHALETGSLLFPFFLYFSGFFLYYLCIVILLFMNIPQSSLSEKCQTTMPSQIREMFGIKAKEQFLWIQVSPGLISLASVKKYKNGTWTKNICGKYAKKVDAVQSLLNDRKEDLELEKRGYLNK